MKVVKKTTNIALTLAILTSTTVTFGAVLKGFSQSFSSGSVGAENTTCATWDECIGSDTSNGNTASSGNTGSGGGNTNSPPANFAGNIYYLKDEVIGLKKHPLFNLPRKPNYEGDFYNESGDFINGNQVIYEFQKKGLKVLPVYDIDMFTGNSVNVSLNTLRRDFVNNESMGALFSVTPIDPLDKTRWQVFRTQNNGRYHRLDLDKDFNYVNEGYGDSIILSSGAKIYRTDGNIDNINQVVVPNSSSNCPNCYNVSIYYNSLKKSPRTGKYSIFFSKEDFAELFTQIDTYYATGFIDVYNINGRLYLYVANKIDQPDRFIRKDITSRFTNPYQKVFVENETSEKIDKSFFYRVARNPVNKYSFCLNARCYSINPSTGALKEEFILPLIPRIYLSSYLGLNTNDAEIVQPTEPVGGKCEYKITPKFLNNPPIFIFRSTFYDTTSNKCYPLSKVERDSEGVRIGNRIYHSIKIKFEGVSDSIEGIGYAENVNGNFIFEMIGYSEIPQYGLPPASAYRAFLFYDPENSQSYLMLGNNIIMDLGTVDKNNLPLEVHLK